MKKIIFLTLLFLIFARPVYAYIDFTSGSYLFQILAAGAIGGIFFFKDIFRKIKEIFGSKVKEEKNE